MAWNALTLCLMFSAAVNIALTHRIATQQRLCDNLTRDTLDERSCYMWSRYKWECEVAETTGLPKPSSPPLPKPSDTELVDYERANP